MTILKDSLFNFIKRIFRLPMPTYCIHVTVNLVTNYWDKEV